MIWGLLIPLTCHQYQILEIDYYEQKAHQLQYEQQAARRLADSSREETDLYPIHYAGRTTYESAGKIAIAVAIREGSITDDYRFRAANTKREVCGIKSRSITGEYTYKRFETVPEGIRDCFALLTGYLTQGVTKGNLDLTLSIWKNGERGHLNLDQRGREATQNYINDIKDIIINRL